MKHFINILDHTTEELEGLLARCSEMKVRMAEGICDRPLIGRRLGMFFEKPSMRTRFSMESAMISLGGGSIFQEGSGSLGVREDVRDTARVISRYVDLLGLRTFSHEILTQLAEYGSVPVVNGLSDYSHPTQAMADVLTVQEHFGTCRDKHLVFLGDGNNVARSLAAVAGRLGMRFTLACPEGYALDAPFVDLLQNECPGAAFTQRHDPSVAVADADIVYTDVWASMGQEEEANTRKAVFADFQLNATLMAKAPSQCRVMHCLPAHRGEEITEEVIESEQSIVFDEAENRMHIYRGLFATLLGQ
ncbi:MAG: ornithine carbamoyltransferase [Planctomycetota bacterium]|jgi:ornithine carbamoyltransferase